PLAGLIELERRLTAICSDCPGTEPVRDERTDPCAADTFIIGLDHPGYTSHADLIKQRPVRPSNYWFKPEPSPASAVLDYMAEYRKHQQAAALAKDSVQFRVALLAMDKAAVEREPIDVQCGACKWVAGCHGEPKEDGSCWEEEDVEDAYLNAMGIDEDGFPADSELVFPCPMVVNGLNVSDDGSTDFTEYCEDCGGCKCHACDC
ncbi:MAG: hypothetical protein KAJ19_26135, partial [Gammaproteobacteria bacterium]|nr:hypothetical protein [Gammaproteobacteria bacterium]